MNIFNENNNFNYELEKLCRIFLPHEKIIFTDSVLQSEVFAHTRLEKGEKETVLSAYLNFYGKQAEFSDALKNDAPDYEKECERVLAVALFKCFVTVTGYVSPWGILTGVRPAKLYSSLCKKGGSEYAQGYFKEKFLVNDKKIKLCEETYRREGIITKQTSRDSFSLYISIPFCPTRCSYCSFVSHSVDKAKKLIPEYLEKLITEIKATAEIANKTGLKLRSVYIGGGTPTTLSAEQLEALMKTVAENFDISGKEYTVEAGRPDTITAEKLKVIKQNGANRISINPQTMNDDVLKIIGRCHTAKDTEDAFILARSLGFDNINMDLIAGLPGETLDSFKDTIKKVIELSPDSVTVHSLALKRAANLGSEQTAFQEGVTASQMVDFAKEALSQKGIVPYYMYRQSKTVGNNENVGYSLPNKESFYNVYIMDETHTILACGASAVTKLRQPGGSYIERIFNYKYPYEYVSNFSEILSRKERVAAFYDEYRI